MDDLEIEIAERERSEKRKKTLSIFLNLLGDPNGVLDLMGVRPQFMQNCANAVLEELNKEAQKF